MAAADPHDVGGKRLKHCYCSSIVSLRKGMNTVIEVTKKIAWWKFAGGMKCLKCRKPAVLFGSAAGTCGDKRVMEV